MANVQRSSRDGCSVGTCELEQGPSQLAKPRGAGGGTGGDVTRVGFALPRLEPGQKRCRG